MAIDIVASIMPFVVLGIAVVLLPLIFIKFIAPEAIKNKTDWAFVIGGLFVLIGFVAAFYVFSAALSMAMLAFSSLLLLPFVIFILEPSQQDHENQTKPGFGIGYFSNLMKKHEKMITFYMLMFFGMVVIYMILFAMLPPAISSNAFSTQLGVFSKPVGHFSLPNAGILINNLQILFIAFALSIFYGAGSLLILNLNASIAGVMYGAPLAAVIWKTAAIGPYYAHILSYIPHTIIEIVGYLFAAIAGGILATHQSRDDIIEALVMFAIGVILIIFGYWVEITVPGSF